MKGRKPKDLALKMLQGQRVRQPLGGTGAPFVIGTPEKPAGLEAIASQEWDRLTMSLAPVLSESSRGLLLVACDAFAEMMVANTVLAAKGRTYETVSESGSMMIRPRPEVRMKENARRAYHQALSELGASPVAQTRVHRLPQHAPSELTGVKRLLG